jgi:ADP-ribose pyrophosphatase YjhB (NUDIX family)
MSRRRQPRLTVDTIIRMDDGRVVLIKRKYEPHGWALPGGFVDYGESLEEAAVREAREETGLEVELIRQMHTYSEKSRDPRGHTVSTVFIARGRGKLEAGDDAGEAATFLQEELPKDMVFDHRQILEDYFTGRY